jgi:hypothetical protein
VVQDAHPVRRRDLGALPPGEQELGGDEAAVAGVDAVGVVEELPPAAADEERAGADGLAGDDGPLDERVAIDLVQVRAGRSPSAPWSSCR